MPVGGIILRSPFDKIIKNLRIASVGVTKTIEAIFLESAALGDSDCFV
ncbi:MAG TPA: hypothetical protein VJZ49_10855 [Syntrophales bacterium]|nr:hypothetical protein [Syntrophales bacterium]